MLKKSDTAVETRKDVTKLGWTLHMMRVNWVGYAMIAPFFIIFLAFTALPVALSFFLSMTDFNMLEVPHILWADNYVQLILEDDLFITALKNTLIFAICTGPISYILSFLIAWFINEIPPKIRAVVTLIFYAPSISGQVYLVWQTLFADDSYGWANAWLTKLGIIDAPILWFHDESWAMVLCIIVALWTSLGTAFLSFIAGLQGIDRAQYEAAAIDGVKNRWQELWYVTLPNMKAQLLFGAVMTITQSFGFGPIVDALCGNPSVNYCCWTLQHHHTEYGNTRWEMGYACSISFVLFLLMFGCNLLIKMLLSKLGS